MSMVEALLEERRGYVVRGLTARIAAVDAALASYGFAAGPEAPEDDGPVVETATVKRGRR